MAGPAETEPLLRAPDVHDEEPCPATGESTASRIAKAQLTTKLPAVMLNFATTGLGQSAIGALIPDIETYYHLKNGPTAFIFPSVIMGYFAAVYLMETMHQRYGRRGLAIVGPLARIAGCGILAFGGPFPVALMSYLIFGFGTGFTDAGLCAWGSGVPFANVVQGIMHGTWSVGCVFGPLVVVHFVDGRMPWYGFYRLLGICSIAELVALTLAFRRDNGAKYCENLPMKSTPSTKYNPLRSKLTWLCALYWFLYCGMESSYGDWIVTYMGEVRHVERATAASAASIFWTGMCIGRVTLSPLTEYIGVNLAVSCYIVIALAAQATLRLVERTSAFLFTLAVIGAFFGPIFPSGIVLLGKKLPLEVHVQAVSTAAALGQSGGALAPLLVGFVADAVGIGRLLDIVTALTVLLIGLWLVFCRSAD